MNFYILLEFPYDTAYFSNKFNIYLVVIYKYYTL